jgi:hypothetical protein
MGKSLYVSPKAAKVREELREGTWRQKNGAAELNFERQS